MSMAITSDEMYSDATRHTARAWPVPGEPTLWSVTWLPGRALTLDQAITAMRLAETVGSHDLLADPLHADHPLWEQLDAWAMDLGISGPRALALASMPPEDVEAVDHA